MGNGVVAVIPPCLASAHVAIIEAVLQETPTAPSCAARHDAYRFEWDGGDTKVSHPSPVLECRIGLACIWGSTTCSPRVEGAAFAKMVRHVPTTSVLLRVSMS